MTSGPGAFSPTSGLSGRKVVQDGAAHKFSSFAARTGRIHWDERPKPVPFQSRSARFLPEGEIFQPPTDGVRDKTWYMHTVDPYPVTQSNDPRIRAATWKHLKKDYTKRKKPVIREHILYDSIYVKSPENAKLQRQKTDHLGAWAGIKECLQTGIRGHFGSVTELDYGNIRAIV